MNVQSKVERTATISTEHFDVVIAGAGISGIGAVYLLRQQGYFQKEWQDTGTAIVAHHYCAGILFGHTCYQIICAGEKHDGLL